ncbi:hypothetical protein ACV07N_04010 [Roseivirga echinicomitans]
MRYSKEIFKIISFSLSIMLLSLFAMPPVAIAQEQQDPIKFQYAGDMKAKSEGGEYYIYVYCNKYEGDTCTSGDGATRLHVPNPSAWFKMLIKPQ